MIVDEKLMRDLQRDGKIISLGVDRKANDIIVRPRCQIAINVCSKLHDMHLVMQQVIRV